MIEVKRRMVQLQKRDTLHLWKCFGIGGCIGEELQKNQVGGVFAFHTLKNGECQEEIKKIEEKEDEIKSG